MVWNVKFSYGLRRKEKEPHPFLKMVRCPVDEISTIITEY